MPDFLLNKFRDSQSYKFEDMNRDLRDVARELSEWSAFVEQTLAAFADWQTNPGEFGDWTPRLVASVADTGDTYINQFGKYFKLGKFVFLSFDVNLSAKGSATSGQQVGVLPLPYIATNTNQANVTIGFASGVTLSSAQHQLTALGSNSFGGTGLLLRETDGLSSAAITWADITVPCRIIGSASYRLA